MLVTHINPPWQEGFPWLAMGLPGTPHVGQKVQRLPRTQLETQEDNTAGQRGAQDLVVRDLAPA